MVCAFVNIDLVAMASWAERTAFLRLLPGTRCTSDVARIVAARIDEVNRTWPGADHGGCQIRRFLILHKELDADDGELTRTQKVRRSAIAGRYCALIEALYDGATEVFAETEVTFEDGRKGRIAASSRSTTWRKRRTRAFSPKPPSERASQKIRHPRMSWRRRTASFF